MPLDLLLLIIDFVSNYKIKYIILKYVQPNKYKSLVFNTKILQRFYNKHKFTNIESNQLWNNKSYIIRLLFKYYDKDTIISLPDNLVKKLKINRYYNNVTPHIENINIKNISERKPSDVLQFLNSTYITRGILCYNGF